MSHRDLHRSALSRSTVDVVLLAQAHRRKKSRNRARRKNRIHYGERSIRRDGTVLSVNQAAGFRYVTELSRFQGNDGDAELGPGLGKPLRIKYAEIEQHIENRPGLKHRTLSSRPVQQSVDIGAGATHRPDHRQHVEYG